jgi:hypothetical protein
MNDTAAPPTPAQVRWHADQLPPVIHQMRTCTGRRLVVRVIRPGDLYGHTARLDGPPVVEVRRWTTLEEATGDAGTVLAVWDLTLLIEEPRAVWHLLTPGLPDAVPAGDLEEMYAVVHAVGVTAATVGV